MHKTIITQLIFTLFDCMDLISKHLVIHSLHISIEEN